MIAYVCYHIIITKIQINWMEKDILFIGGLGICI